MRKLVVGVAGALLAGMAAPALAGGAYCTPDWAPENPDLGCASQIVIAPGNDTRINILLLMQDRAGRDGAELGYPELDWDSFYGRNFLRWRFFAPAWYDAPLADSEAYDDGEYYTGYGGRCQTLESGKVAFLGALDGLRGLKSEDKSLLTTSRDRLKEFCSSQEESAATGFDGYFVNVGDSGIKDAPFAYMVYLEGAAAFYDGNWERAKKYFGFLAATSLDGWATETAKYMQARTLLNEAIDSAEDEDGWGWFELGQADGSVARQSETAFNDYLKAYPEGRYVASASGLIRKALWLQRDYGRLGTTYAAMLAEADPGTMGAMQLIEEVDDKLIIRDSAASTGDPLLTAITLLMRMRDGSWFDYEDDEKQAQLTRGELDAKADVFADQPELWSFLQANHAFYVAKDHKAARDLLPDDARRESYTPLAFSRQYLRGLALHALRDPNEEGFWRELISGAKGAWQKPAVELALARVLEQKGELDEVFAADSPISDSRIRRMLLGDSAGPDLLKKQARAEGTPAGEPAFALFTVLWRQLQHGDYTGFLADYPLTEKYELNGESYGLWGMLDDPNPAAAIFRTGKFSDDYACPTLEKTARLLARNPNDAKGMLCLGDFYRLNGFDDFSFGEPRWIGLREVDTIAQRDTYPGDPTPRLVFYTRIIADNSVSADDKAYALYRAVRCYAPSGNNTCSTKGVDVSVRKQWFQRLKRDYPNSRWAKGLEYYW